MADYDILKSEILRGRISVDKFYLPTNSKVFNLIFHKKDIAETAIRAVMGEDICILDPLVEHDSDVIKAIESRIRTDVFCKGTDGSIYTLDMQRTYEKKRNRNRMIY